MGAAWLFPLPRWRGKVGVGACSERNAARRPARSRSAATRPRGCRSAADPAGARGQPGQPEGAVSRHAGRTWRGHRAVDAGLRRLAASRGFRDGLRSRASLARRARRAAGSGCADRLLVRRLDRGRNRGRRASETGAARPGRSGRGQARRSRGARFCPFLQHQPGRAEPPRLARSRQAPGRDLRAGLAGLHRRDDDRRGDGQSGARLGFAVPLWMAAAYVQPATAALAAPRRGADAGAVGGERPYRAPRNTADATPR